MNSPGIFAAVAAAAGSSTDPALIAGDRSWSRDELLLTATELSEALARRYSGSAVVVESDDPVATALLTLAADRAGIPLLHRDPATAAGPSGPAVRDGAGPAGTERPARPGTQESPFLGLVRAAAADGLEPATELPPDAQVFFTSGSTGTPMAVVRSRAAVLADARRVADFLGYEPGAPVVCAAPVFHAYGFNYGLIAPLVAGAPVRLLPSRCLPSTYAAAVRALDARTLIALPAHYGLLAQGTGRQGATVQDLARLNAAVSAGAALPPVVQQRPGNALELPLYNCYGSSEAGAMTLSRVDRGQEPGDIGEPLPGVRVRLDGGELQVRTSSLALGRFGPGTRNRLLPVSDPDGWYRTGDLAQWSGVSPGRLTLLGRSAAVINVAGEKVSPGEVERVISQHPGVLDVSVCALADEVRGEVPVARVVLRPGAVAGELIEWCRAELAPHQMPRAFEPVDHIPRSATGKALRARPVRDSR
ncbi:class I adenylate-forming enzyme family protein [Kitasatospora sp. NBC_01266]|uniref:class I adenylate-forming enzyme family protein n=1 Tax=Kitasatospora sp. NBC_01266 TaxID=2903572 RepID=UPI002E311642|nr:fatty acid--CoA ligase family protein [Kitasatospora sp. NBC_01266]